ncbi:MAG: bifunctional riboflavin kinase/FAD synthetase [Gemmatimonadaceae bacterium]|nr:bifunctional riboflavin kinase/FAD synthetase [Gemmatimonadaceae bacterium]
MTIHRALPVGEHGAVLTVGTFDGMHRGHQDVLSRLVARASLSGRCSVVVTFDPHPLQVVNPAAVPPLLSTFPEKLEQFVQAGVQYVVVLPFTTGLAALSAEAFVDDVLIARYGMTELLVGHDHGFGRGRLGDIRVLRELGARRGFAVNELAPVVGKDAEAISSSVIRRAVASGDLRVASDGLGRHYTVSGRVVPGDQRGRQLGYRTLNLETPPATKLLPPDGVYAVRVQTPRGPCDGMLNLGGRPTFGDSSRRLEAHVFDAEADWYGATIRVDFVAWIRATRPFPSPTDLVRQLADDEKVARALLATGAETL